MTLFTYSSLLPNAPFTLQSITSSFTVCSPGGKQSGATPYSVSPLNSNLPWLLFPLSMIGLFFNYFLQATIIILCVSQPSSVQTPVLKIVHDQIKLSHLQYIQSP